MLRARAARGTGDHEPIFCDALGGHRDPATCVASSGARQLARRQPGTARPGGRAGQGAQSRPPHSARRRGPTGLAADPDRSGRDRAPPRRPDRRGHALGPLRSPGSTSAGHRGPRRGCGRPVDADALSWITSHNFRKTTATILDEAGQSARAIAEQLGHARPSMTQDVYMGRGTTNPGAAEAIQRAMAQGASPTVTTRPERKR